MHSNAVMPVSLYDYTNQLLAIIDSRLQFISYKMEEFSNISIDQDFGSSRSDSMVFVQQTNLAFQIIERLTHQKSRLLLLRKYTNAQNLDVVYQLLQDDAYLNYSIDHLRYQLLGTAVRVLDNNIPRASSIS